VGKWPERGDRRTGRGFERQQWWPAGARADSARETRVRGGGYAAEAEGEDGEALGARNLSGSGVDGRRGVGGMALLGFCSARPELKKGRKAGIGGGMGRRDGIRRG